HGGGETRLAGVAAVGLAHVLPLQCLEGAGLPTTVRHCPGAALCLRFAGCDLLRVVVEARAGAGHRAPPARRSVLVGAGAAGGVAVVGAQDGAVDGELLARLAVLGLPGAVDAFGWLKGTDALTRGTLGGHGGSTSRHAR